MIVVIEKVESIFSRFNLQKFSSKSWLTFVIVGLQSQHFPVKYGLDDVFVARISPSAVDLEGSFGSTIDEIFRRLFEVLPVLLISGPFSGLISRLVHKHLSLRRKLTVLWVDG